MKKPFVKLFFTKGCFAVAREWYSPTLLRLQGMQISRQAGSVPPLRYDVPYLLDHPHIWWSLLLGDILSKSK